MGETGMEKMAILYFSWTENTAAEICEMLEYRERYAASQFTGQMCDSKRILRPKHDNPKI